MLVVVYTTMYVYNIIDTVPGIYMYCDTCVEYACINVIGTTGVPELADCLLIYYCTLLAWLVVATTNASTG